MINAVVDMESSLMLTHGMRTHFSKLTIIGRARNVTHLFNVRTRDVDLTERETVESALLIDPKALEQMGPIARRRKSGKEVSQAQSRDAGCDLPCFRDESKRISIAQKARDGLAKSFEQDGFGHRNIGSPISMKALLPCGSPGLGGMTRK